ncbi:hypothetical protein IM774_12640 [Erysipelotrichaceae bacterium RD49]|nr:hypothetical protein [Erysipelotrichaceae bacterium RD49]
MIERMNRNQVLQDWDQILESAQTNEIVFCKQATPLPDPPSSRKSGWPQNRKRKYQYYIEQNRGCNSPGKKQVRQLWQDLQLQYTASSTQENTKSELQLTSGPIPDADPCTKIQTDGFQLGAGSPAFGGSKKLTDPMASHGG